MEMNPGSYRLKSETIALQERNGRLGAVLVPEGTILVVRENFAIRQRLIECLWNGQPVAVFAVDLLQRGERIRCATS